MIGGRGELDGAGTFFCNGCSERMPKTVRHESGFCTLCIAAGHRFWRGRLPLHELLEIADLIWPEDRPGQLDVAA